MDIWELDKLVLFIAFVIPGFISIKVYDLLIPTNKLDSSKILIDAIAYSSINYALLSIPILAVEASELKQVHPNCYAFFYFMVLFLAPILWALVWKWLRTRQFFQKNAPHPTSKSWDYVFSQRKPYWMKITLKNGSKIGGKFAEKSFASSTPAEEQIYLEEVWLLNDKGGFDRPKNETEGIIIMSSEILYVEFFKYN